MTPPKSCPPWQRAIITQSAVMIGVVILGVVYAARSLVIPIAMAVFFSYVLDPVVRLLSRRGLGRSLSVLLTVGFATLLVLGTSVIITRQVTSMSQTLAGNTDRIKGKLASARNFLGSESSYLQQAFDDLETTIVGGVHEAKAQANDRSSVTISPSRPRWMSAIDQIIGPVTEAFGMAAFSFILVVFILLAREDLKDRFLRLLGDGTVSSATRALDDATTRLSRYLLAQFLLNIGFGLVIAVAVWCLGLQYAVLWGFIATLLRYVPYLGTWIGVVLPVGFSFATSEDWWQPIEVVVLYGVLELVTGNVIEPFLYGSKLGVSEVAQLISAAFWSYILGPIGLILSGPISTCLVVLGRHSPRFRFLYILLGSEPPLAPEVALFQRLMTTDSDEAMRVVEKNTPKEQPQRVFDDLIVPAVVQVKKAIHSGEFGPDEVQSLVASAREVMLNTVENVRQAQPAGADPVQPNRLLLIPARDAADQLAADLLVELLPSAKWKVDVAGVDTLASEVIERVTETKPDAVCIVSLPPAGLVQTRYLCKRLRQHHPDVRVLVCRWGDDATPEAFAELTAAGATAVDVKLETSLTQLAAWRPLVDAEAVPEKKASSRPALGTSSATSSAVVS